jgi:hypothetical protein
LVTAREPRTQWRLLEECRAGRLGGEPLTQLAHESLDAAS